MELSQNYREYLINWCNAMNQSSQQLVGNLGFHTKERFQKWKRRIQQFKTQLEHTSRDERLNDLYKAAHDLYIEWVGLKQSIAHEALERKRKMHETKSNEHLPADNKRTYGMVGIGEHRLPPLPYSYDALEPYIGREIMRLHHLKHHKSYVEGLNKAEREMLKARENSDFKLIKHWAREAAFHGAGHYLHTIFWEIMSPKGGGRPIGKIKQAIDQSFGSFEKFKKHFSEAAKNVEAVGWALLVWSPRSHRLEILQAEKHQNLSQWDVVPLLVLDVWEHAYYLQYKNNRGQYVDNWWNVVNWNAVEDRFRQAEKLRWRPF